MADGIVDKGGLGACVRGMTSTGKHNPAFQSSSLTTTCIPVELSVSVEKLRRGISQTRKR